jgi:hypothetical protein
VALSSSELRKPICTSISSTANATLPMEVSRRARSCSSMRNASGSTERIAS